MVEASGLLLEEIIFGWKSNSIAFVLTDYFLEYIRSTSTNYPEFPSRPLFLLFSRDTYICLATTSIECWTARYLFGFFLLLLKTHWLLFEVVGARADEAFSLRPS